MLSTPTTTASSSSSSFSTTTTTAKILSSSRFHHVPAIVFWTVLATQALLLLSKTQAFSLSVTTVPPAKTVPAVVSQSPRWSATTTLSAGPIPSNDAYETKVELAVVESPFLTWKRHKLQQAAAQENPLLIDTTTTSTSTSAAFSTTPFPPLFWKWWKHPHSAQATSSTKNPGALSSSSLSSSVSGGDDLHDGSSSSSSSSSSSTTTTTTTSSSSSSSTTLSLVENNNDNHKPNDVRRFHSLVRETTSIATACLVAAVLVYCSANDQMLLVDALRFVCSCFTSLCDKGLLAVARTTTSAAAASASASASSSNVATNCVHALREVAMVCSAMSVTHKQQNHHRKQEENVSIESNHSNTESDDENASLSWLARVKMATLHLLPAMNIVLSSASTIGKLQSWNELLYQALVTASSVDNFISPLEDEDDNDDKDEQELDPEPVQHMDRVAAFVTAHAAVTGHAVPAGLAMALDHQ